MFRAVRADVTVEEASQVTATLVGS
jgi:hypothetical protein